MRPFSIIQYKGILFDSGFKPVRTVSVQNKHLKGNMGNFSELACEQAPNDV